MQNTQSVLRVVHIHGDKTLKIRPLWQVFLDYFITRPSINAFFINSLVVK